MSAMPPPPPPAGDPADAEVSLLLGEAAGRLFTDTCTPAFLRRAEADPSLLDGLWVALTAQGLDAACAPRERGGSGLGWASVRALIEACGRYGVPAALPETLAATLLARAAGLAVPDRARLTLAIARDDDSGVVADAVPGATQVEAVVVQRGADLACLRVAEADAVHRVNGAGEARSLLRWTSVPQRAWQPAADQDLLLAGAAIRTAQIAGAAGRVAELAVRYANDRQQFGRPIAKFQAIQQQLAVAAEWSAMASMASCLALSDPGTSLLADRVSAAREVACTAAEQVSAVAHAVHGAIGITAEYDLQLFTRRLKSWAGEFGSQRYWASRLGQRMLQGDSPRVWDHVVALATV